MILIGVVVRCIKKIKIILAKKNRFKNLKNGFGLLTHRTFKIIWFSNFLTLSVTWWRLLQKHIMHTKFDIYVFIIKLIIRKMETHWLILLHTIPLITTHSLHNHTSMTNKSKSWVKNKGQWSCVHNVSKDTGSLK